MALFARAVAPRERQKETVAEVVGMKCGLKPLNCRRGLALRPIAGMVVGVSVRVKAKEDLAVIFWHIVNKGWVDIFIDHGRDVCRGRGEFSRWGANGRLSWLPEVFQNALKVGK